MDNAPKDWSASDLANLRKLLAEELSCSQIAAQIGRTRNAVIGKLHREGLSKPRMLRQKPAPSAYRKQATAHVRRAVKRAVIVAPCEPAGEYSLPPIVLLAKEQRKDCEPKLLLDLEAGECRWPLNDGGPWLFCGQPAHDVHSYCAQHCRTAFTKYAGAA